MEKKFKLAAGRAFGERRRLASETVDEELIDSIIAQFGAGDEVELCARLYKHSMFAAKEIQPGDLQNLRERTPGIARIGQGFEGVVEVLSDANGNLCIKRRYGIGDRKERIQNLRKNYSFKVEFDLHSKAQALGVKVPRLVAYTRWLCRTQWVEKSLTFQLNSS